MQQRTITGQVPVAVFGVPVVWGRMPIWEFWRLQSANIQTRRSGTLVVVAEYRVDDVGRLPDPDAPLWLLNC